MVQSQLVKTRVLFLSDTHATDTSQPFNQPFPSADVIIHSGDLTTTGTIQEHRQALTLLKSLTAPLKIVVPGNHDLTLDKAWYADSSKGQGRKGHPRRPIYAESELDAIRELYVGAEAKKDGIIYIEEGVRSFELVNGAMLNVYASAYTPEFHGWAFAYPVDHNYFGDSTLTAADKFNIDIFVTHGPPHTVLDKTMYKDVRAGCPWLLQAVSKHRPLIHCFGHIHEGWGALRRTWPVRHDKNQNRSLTQRFASGYRTLTNNLTNSKQDLYQSLKKQQLLDLEESLQQQTQIDINPDTQQDIANENTTVYVDATNLVPRSGKADETLFINASMMDVKYKPVNKAFLVDVMLRKKQDGSSRL